MMKDNHGYVKIHEVIELDIYNARNIIELDLVEVGFGCNIDGGCGKVLFG